MAAAAFAEFLFDGVRVTNPGSKPWGTDYSKESGKKLGFGGLTSLEKELEQILARISEIWLPVIKTVVSLEKKLAPSGLADSGSQFLLPARMPAPSPEQASVPVKETGSLHSVTISRPYVGNKNLIGGFGASRKETGGVSSRQGPRLECWPVPVIKTVVSLEKRLEQILAAAGSDPSFFPNTLLYSCSSVR